MKRFFSNCVYVAVTAIAIMTFSFTPAFAADTVPKSEDTGFSASSDSTWGDLYRYFEPERFESLPEEIQRLYNSTILGSANSNISFDTAKSDNSLVEDTKTISKLHETVDFDDDMTIVSTEGYLYYENGESTSVDENSRLSSKGVISMEGLLNLTMGLSSSTDEIEYTTVMSSTKKCPEVLVNMSLYDTVSKKYVGFDDGKEKNAKICTLDDSFTGLVSGRKYRAEAMGLVSPPDGYYANPLYLSYNKSTK